MAPKQGCSLSACVRPHHLTIAIASVVAFT
jgi:hypothetical protein